MIYEIKELSFKYTGYSGNILNRVSLTINGGDVVTVFGRNGAGKSTLLNCMLGLLKPQNGKLLLVGQNLDDMSEREIASAVGYVPQNHVPAFSFSVLDFVLMGFAARIGLFSKPGKREREQAEESLAELGIEALADKSYLEISGGERQKASIARAIVSKPRAVLFDEPTAHLDFGSQLRVLRIIRGLSEKGYAVVMTTHNPDHALLLGGKSALIDSDGCLVCGDVETIVTQDNLTKAYGADVRLEYIENLGRKACLYPNL